MALKMNMPDAATGRKAVMAAGTFAVAMGVGFFMQQGDASAARLAESATLPNALPISETEVAAVAEVNAAPAADPAVVVVADVQPVDEVAENPALDDASFAAVVEVADTVAPETLTPALDLSPLGLTPVALEQPEPEQVASCEPFMSARVADAALVDLIVAAPCHAGQPFTLHHEGLMFTVMTDQEGNAKVTAPALSETAVFIAAFDDGVGAVADAQVPELLGFDRVVLQWQGQSGFEIHAKEFGADYGQDGHVWRDAARDVTAALEGQGGFLMQLGELAGADPLLAEVYTFPSGQTPQAGTIDLTVEAEVTALNCSKDISAQTLERTPDAQVRIADLTLSMPECAAIGEFLVLQDLLADLTLAQG